MTISNTYITDTLIRRQTYIERLKSARERQYTAVTTAVERALRNALVEHDVERVSDLTKAQLNQVVMSVKTSYNEEMAVFIAALLLWLQEFSHDEAEFQTSLFNDTIEEAEVPIIEPGVLWSFVRNVGVGAVGLTVFEFLADLRISQAKAIAKAIKLAYVQKRTLRQLRIDIIGTASRRFKDGVLGGFRRGAGAVISTAIQHGTSASRFRTMGLFKEWVHSYEWVSILDSKTSAICRSLDGRIFVYGSGPIPPIHIRCRSHIEAIFNNSTRFTRGGTRKTSAGPTVGNATYYSWLKTQGKAFQDDVLGTTRGELFRKGGVSADEFARLNLSRNFEPLTLDELRKKRPALFDNAGI